MHGDSDTRIPIILEVRAILDSSIDGEALALALAAEPATGSASAVSLAFVCV